MSEFIQVHDLCKFFLEGNRKIHVLRDLNLKLGEGEKLAIVGESGVGKSTLLHILGSLDRSSSGCVFYRGKDIATLTREELSIFRNQEIGFVFQFHYLLPDFTALENVMLPALIRGWNWRRARQSAEQLLEMIGLKNRFHHQPGKLSGGEQQRIAVARSVILEPKLILADEPTGNLDPYTATEIEDILLRFNKENCMTLIIATHNRKFASRIGHQMELRDGQLLL